MRQRVVAKKNHDQPPIVLAILDGWGIAPPGSGNAISLAKTPNLDAFTARYPHTRLQAHGRYVGLLPDQEGNSEAGHMCIGAGRTVRQDIVYVSEAIKDGTFFKNTAFHEAFKHVKKYETGVHLMGLLSNDNSAHAAPEHLYALLELCRREHMKEVWLHLFTDGRDSPPFAATEMLHDLEKQLSPGQRIATVTGRFYAMDRNKIWDRTEHAYNAIVGGEGVAAASAHRAVIQAYGRGEADEFILPTVIVDEKKRPIGKVADNDVVFFFNLRSDRVRQLTKCFVQRDFEARNDHAFVRKIVPKNTRFVAMTGFGPDLPHILTAYPSRDVIRGLTETLGGQRQLYIAESEKYAHVTYFFNGGYAEMHHGEVRMRVPSAFVAHHDDRPEMRAGIITSEIERRLHAGLHDFYVINYANADMIGHTGNIGAAVKAIEEVDSCLGHLSKAVLAKKGALFIVGDHGNAEVMRNEETGETITEHTANPVPFHLVAAAYRKRRMGEGMLADVAPTILDVMGVPKPSEMTGFSLLR